MDKREELDELVSNSVTPDEYEVHSVLPCLCLFSFLLFALPFDAIALCLQRFDAVGWAAGRASYL